MDERNKTGSKNVSELSSFDKEDNVDSDIQAAKKKMLSEGIGSQAYQKQPEKTGDYVSHGLDKNIGFIRFVIYDGSGILFLENEYGTATLAMRMKNKLINENKLAKFSKEILIDSCEEVYDLLPDKANDQFKSSKKDFFDYCVWIFHLSTIVNAPVQVRKDELLNALDLIVPDVLFVQDRPCFSYFPINSSEMYIESGSISSDKVKSRLGLTDEQLKQKEEDYRQFSYALLTSSDDGSTAFKDSVDNGVESTNRDDAKFYSYVENEEGLAPEAQKIISTSIETPVKPLSKLAQNAQEIENVDNNDGDDFKLNSVPNEDESDDMFNLSQVDED